jgi:hypothetical protein
VQRDREQALAAAMRGILTLNNAFGNATTADIVDFLVAQTNNTGVDCKLCEIAFVLF